MRSRSCSRSSSSPTAAGSSAATSRDGGGPEHAADDRGGLKRALLVRRQEVDSRGERGVHRVGQAVRAAGSPSVRVRAISSRKNGLPSARATISACSRLPRPCSSSRPTSCALSSASSGSTTRPVKLRRPPPQVGRRVVSSGRAVQSRRTGPAAWLATSSSSSRTAASAHWTSSTSTIVGARDASAEKNARHARCVSARTSCAFRCERSIGARPMLAVRNAASSSGASAPAAARTAAAALDTCARAVSACSSSRDCGERLQHLGERPVADAVAVGETAAADDAGLRRRGLEARQQLADQPALADARLAVERDEVRAAPPRPRAGRSSSSSSSSRRRPTSGARVPDSVPSVIG